MLLKEILTAVETAAHPVAKALHNGPNFKTIAIAFKNGMILKEHKANLPTKLFVLNGSIVYQEKEASNTLSTHDEINIPINRLHSVTALEDSLCLLTQG